MAVALISQPGDIVFARNPVVIQLRASTTVGGPTYAAKGVGAYFQAALTARIATGATLTVAYTEADGTAETVVLTAAADYTPDAAIPDNSFSGTDAEYWSAVAVEIAAHPRIGPFFSVSPIVSGADVQITLREKSTLSGWAITLSNSDGYPVTPLAAMDDSTPANYRVLFEVFFEKTYRGGDYISAALLEGQPDGETGYLFFDIGQVLESQCRAYRSEPLVPTWSTVTPVIADNLRRWYVRYTEQAGIPATTQDWQYTDVKLAMDGGISQSAWAENPDYLETLTTGNSILSWLPDGRPVVKEAPEFLAWFNTTHADAMLRLNRQLFSATDGLAYENQTWYDASPIVARPYETVLFPLRPLLNATDFDNPDAYKSRMVVLDEADMEVSPPWIYYHDKTYYESLRHIQYINGFGVPETWTCRGQYAKRLRVSRSTAQRPLSPGFDAYATDTFQYASESEPQFTYRTGYLSKGLAETLQELLMVGELYDVSEDGYVPLLLTSNDFQITDTRESLHAYEFTAVPRLRLRNYSKRAVVAPDLNAWQEPGGEYWFDTAIQPWELP